MSNIPHDCYCFVVDTDSYAGNFERDMCAYMTGCIGECEVGEEYKNLYFTEYKKEIELYDVIDENCCRRPVTRFENKNGKYNSFIIFFGPKKPSPKIIKRLKDRAYKFLTCKNFCEFDTKPKQIFGFRLLYSPPLKLENVDIE